MNADRCFCVPTNTQHTHVPYACTCSVYMFVTRVCHASVLWVKCGNTVPSVRLSACLTTPETQSGSSMRWSCIIRLRATSTSCLLSLSTTSQPIAKFGCVSSFSFLVVIFLLLLDCLFHFLFFVPLQQIEMGCGQMSLSGLIQALKQRPKRIRLSVLAHISYEVNALTHLVCSMFAQTEGERLVSCLSAFPLHINSNTM